MNRSLLILIIILALASMAPGTPRPKPTTPATEPPPVETEPPATEPVETIPPAIDTEPPTFPTEPPAVFTEVAPRNQPTQWKPDTDKFKNAQLPAGGFGPQGTPEPVRCLSLLVVLAVLAWRLVK